jgi:hypothetical protein
MRYGKDHPIRGYKGPEGDIGITTLNGGRWLMACPGCFTPEKDPVPIV